MIAALDRRTILASTVLPPSQPCCSAGKVTLRLAESLPASCLQNCGEPFMELVTRLPTDSTFQHTG